ncbi:MAG: hypothetical protein GVY08_11370 [Bacteroidetes bacterium]|jgi:hypothetical protein|nr:hypothetical protein [Bacteroidota bacterium]
MSKELPDLHRQAFIYKNSKKLQHDGGRAWIKDSQLHEARKDANGKLLTKEDKKLKKPGSPDDKVKSI